MDVHSTLNQAGIHSESLIAIIIAVATGLLIILLSWLVYWVTKKWLGRVIVTLARLTSFRWDDLMFDRRFFERLGWLLASVVARVGVNRAGWEEERIVTAVVDVWIIFACVRMLSAVLDGLDRIYENYSVSKDHPIKVFVQLAMIFFWCAGIIVAVGLFTEKSISAMLAGLTAFAAVLMLIFRDSILGFVAGIQLSANNMVRIGDWIVMPSSGADGNVTEITLTTVKVQNWDMTITTIPTYKLVSESFTNWRGMVESDGRRIKRSVIIDIDSVHYLTPEEIENLKGSALLRDYMEGKIADIDRFNSGRGNPLDERHLTNLGTFREYLESWLERNPDINLQMTHMVRQLQSGPTGLPLEIYCFSARQQWTDYEGVQSDIFDHVFAVMNLFGLKAFQYSGQIAASDQKN